MLMAHYYAGHSREPSYKSVYFNFDEYSGFLFCLIVGGMMTLHVTVRTVGTLIWRRKIRWYASIFIVYMSSETSYHLVELFFH